MAMPSEPRVTLRDIAQRIGVSHVTVSLALKNHPRISKKRRLQVQELAREMGYHPDPMLSSLIAYRHGKKKPLTHSAIAWINHWEKPNTLRQVHVFNQYWKGASQAAERYGYRLEEFIWNKEMTPHRMETILSTRNITGVLIPPHPKQPNWETFNWEKFSVIRFGLSIKSPTAHLVTSDHVQGTVLATQTMHEYGYERIGFVVSNSFDRHLGGNHVAGFQIAQRIQEMKYQLPVLFLPDNERDILKQFEKWFIRHRPDAILTTQIGMPELLKSLNIRIPEELALASSSLEDIPEIDAGLNQNSEEIGKVAVDTLISLINSNEKESPVISRRILVASSWKDGPTLPRRN